MEFIKNLPWAWIAGITGVSFLGFSIFKMRAREAPPQSSNSGGSGAGVTPMFGVTAGGSFAGSSSDVPVLGGDVWSAPTGDTGPSDAVLIQQSNERIALENLEMQRYVADKSFQLLYQPVTNTNNTGNMGAMPLPNINGVPLSISPALQASINATGTGIQSMYDTPSQYPGSIKVSTNEATAYISNQAASNDWQSVYNEAANRGYSAAETATLINQSGVTGVGTLSAADVNAWTREQGLAPL